MELATTSAVIWLSLARRADGFSIQMHAKREGDSRRDEIRLSSMPNMKVTPYFWE
jgi:hypothetical protein